MEFRRSGQRDERRRRVLMDEKHASPEEYEETPARGRKTGGGISSSGKTYSDAALRERLPRVVDLLPTRAWTLSVLVLSALTVVAGLAAANAFLPDLAQIATRADLAALDMAGSSSIAAWFSSLLFTIAAGNSLLIYSLRRHKVDDYRGRYLVWLPAAAALLLLSVDATAGLHRLAAGSLAKLSGVTGFGNGTLWSAALYGLLFATLGLRIGIEMRRSRGAIVALVVAAICYGVCMPIWLGVWLSGDAALGALARSVVTLLGHVAVCTSVGLYARYVFLDAQGQLAARKTKAKKPRKTKSDATEKEAGDGEAAAKTSGKTRRIDSAHTDAPAPKTAQPVASGTPNRAAGPLASKMAATATSGAPSSKFGDATSAKSAATVTRQSSQDDDDDDEDDDDGDSRMSRSERKRLKKLQRQGRS